jgi:NAD-dependent deacetylase
MILSDYQVEIQKIAQLLKNASHAVAITGAGISTSSGIPDFRSSATGLWSQNDPMRVASLSAFRLRPQVFFNWLRPLAETMIRADPNPAHYALAGLENSGILKAIITQNIDGLHQRAGSRNVIEVHGTIATLTCPACLRQYPEKDFRSSFIDEKAMPYCPECGKLLKPDVVLFEEMLPADAWESAEQHCQESDLILVAGSSLEVFPVNQLPLNGLSHGAKLIIINYTPTPLDSQADLRLPADLSIILPLIQEAVL